MKFSDEFFEDEVRDGFYVPGIMKRLWAASLEVLELVDGICRRHGIRWFAMYGTLLGAARHQGFVPWDDDIDIGMLREDFDCFREVAERELPPGHVIGSFSNADDHLEGLTLSIFVGTTYLYSPKELLEKYHGYPFRIGIDIFPFDRISQDAERERSRRIVWLELFELSQMFLNQEFSDELENAVSRAEKALRIVHNGSRAYSLRERLEILDDRVRSFFCHEDVEFVGNIPNTIALGDKAVYPRRAFEDNVLLPFEEGSISVPRDYEEILRMIYGDWRKLVKGGTMHSYPSFHEVSEMALAAGFPRLPHLFPYRISSEDMGAAERMNEPGSAGQNLEDFPWTLPEPLSESLPESFSGTSSESFQGISPEAVSGNSVEVFSGIMSEAVSGILFDEPQLYDFDSSVPPGKKEVLFLPRRARDFGTMEGFWRKACGNPEWKVSVVPVPWRLRGVDGGLKDEIHCDIDAFPDYVGALDYRDYDVAKHAPDMIIIQIPYDEYNNAMSLDPCFYARALRKHTKRLVYVPWFTLDDNDDYREGRPSGYNMRYYVLTPGVVLSDIVMVQSEKMKEAYVGQLVRAAGEGTEKIWDRKIQVIRTESLDYSDHF